MVGTTLIDIREHIEALASDDGVYYLVCGRTGDRPVPVAGMRFDGRATARSAARAAEQYRTALRRYDPQVPYYDLIVCQETEPVTEFERLDRRDQDDHQRTLSEPVLDGDSTTPERRDLVEFCHRVAGAVFETLSEEGYDAVLIDDVRADDTGQTVRRLFGPAVLFCDFSVGICQQLHI
jgi:hypothetical protein